MVVPRSTNTVQADAFAGCVDIVSVVIEFGAESIDKACFEGCVNLVTVSIPPSVKHIGSGAFRGCTSLTSLVVPASVEWIERDAFAGCTWLVVIEVLGPDVTLVNRKTCDFRWFAHQFQDCTHLHCVLGPALVPLPRMFHFGGCHALGDDGIVDDTPATRHRAWSLRYWSWKTHHLCSPTHRQWVVHMFLCIARVRHAGRVLPQELWMHILGFLLRWQLGDLNASKAVCE